MDSKQSNSHSQLYDAYLAAAAEEARLDASANTPENISGFDAASGRKYDLIDTIIATPATTPAALYVQSRVLSDLIEGHDGFEPIQADARLLKALVDGLARLAAMEPTTCGGDDSALAALERLHDGAYREWDLAAKYLPDGADVDEADDGYSDFACAMIDAAALIPAKGPAGLGVKARLLAHRINIENRYPALEQSLSTDVKRLAAAIAVVGDYAAGGCADG